MAANEVMGSLSRRQWLGGALVGAVSLSAGLLQGCGQDAPPGAAPARVYRCSVCGYEYDSAKGDPDRGTPPGTRFEDLPDGWTCPRCNSAKAKFGPLAG